MSPVFVALLALFASTFQARAAQQAEIAALRHQIVVLQRSAPRRLRQHLPGSGKIVMVHEHVGRIDDTARTSCHSACCTCCVG